MSDAWKEYSERVSRWLEADDFERLEMVRRFESAFRHRETSPDIKLAMTTECRDEAKRLNEPWWVLYFEGWMLDTMTSDQHDFAKALPVAIELMVRFSSPEGRVHPSYSGILTSVLYTYLSIDPLGYRDELEKGFAYLDGHEAAGPGSNRFVMYYRWTNYLHDIERWKEAYDLAHLYLGKANQDGQAWYISWALYLMCRICHDLKLSEELAGHAEYMVEVSKKSRSSERTLADALIWLALTKRLKGDQKKATSLFHEGMSHLKHVETRDEICADSTAAYYEAGRDWKSAVAVRDRELASVSKNGQLHRACQAQIERCRLLSLAGELTPGDLQAARESALKMKIAEWYLERIDRIEAR